VTAVAADPGTPAPAGNPSLQRAMDALGWSGSAPSIDLSRQDARDALQKSDPAAYAKAVQFLEAASRISCGSGGLRAIQVQLPAGRCGSFFLKTSSPAKRDIRFSIDGRRFHSLVRVIDAKAGLKPAALAK